MGYAPDATEVEFEIQQPLQPLDARVEDMTVLSTSLRVESPGLALPSDFDEVYRVPGDPNKLMRVNGAIYAVFDQSVYASYKGHTYAQVPPSTVFHIGAPPQIPTATNSSEAPEVLEPASSDFTQAGFGVVAPVGPDRHVGFSSEQELARERLPRFVTDKSYRIRRLAEMVQRRTSPSDDRSP